MEMDGKTALITGASRGIGAAVARMLHERGANLGLASRSGDDLGLERAVAHPCDVRDIECARRSLRRDRRALRRHRHRRRECRGRSVRAVPRPLARASRRDDRRQPQRDAVRNSRGAASHARSRGRRRDARLGGRAARASVEAVYCASKFGQVGFTRALDHELREQGIRCTNVCPGGVATDFALDEGRGRTPDALPGMMTAEDVAEVVLFVLERPRHLRILETALRPVTEASWG